MPITSGSFGKALFPGVNAWYGDEYKQFKAEYPEIYKTYSSRRNSEEDISYSGFGLAQVRTEGASVTYDTAQQGFLTRYTHVEYALGFIITRIMVEDDLYDIIAPKRARALAQSMRKTKETVAANVLNRAFNSSYTGGDGLELCSTVHLNVAGGTWANELATAADFSQAAVEQALIDIANWTDDRGLKAAFMPQKLVIPVNLQFEVDRVLNSPLEAYTAENTKNVMKGKFPGGVVMNHYLTDTDAWFILTDCQDGLKHFERRSDDFTMDNDFDTDNAKYKATGRYSFGWSDPKSIFGSPGA